MARWEAICPMHPTMHRRKFGWAPSPIQAPESWEVRNMHAHKDELFGKYCLNWPLFIFTQVQLFSAFNAEIMYVLYISQVSNSRPVGQIWPASPFYMAHKKFKWCLIWCLRVRRDLMCVQSKRHHLIKFTQNFINIVVNWDNLCADWIWHPWYTCWFVLTLHYHHHPVSAIM